MIYGTIPLLSECEEWRKNIVTVAVGGTCNGILLDNNLVATAKHCIDDFDGDNGSIVYNWTGYKILSVDDSFDNDYAEIVTKRVVIKTFPEIGKVDDITFLLGYNHKKGEDFYSSGVFEYISTKYDLELVHSHMGSESGLSGSPAFNSKCEYIGALSGTLIKENGKKKTVIAPTGFYRNSGCSIGIIN